MIRRTNLLAAGLLQGLATRPAAQTYFPAPGDAWERREPRGTGYDPAKLQTAIRLDPAHDLVVVTRWLQSARINQFVGKLMEAYTGS